MAREAIVLILILLTAGCITQTPAALNTTDPARGVEDLVYDLAGLVDVAVEVEGGVNLRGTVFLPDVPPGTKVPVVLDMGPYYGQIMSGETFEYNEEHPPNLLYEHLLRRGYAIALVSVRGTGLSEGCFMVGGAQERADVAAVVEWLAAQEWSNGNVGMTGVSYDGTTPWEALVSGAAPSLKAIVPVEGISDYYRYSFFEGVPIGGGAAFNTYYEALVDATYTSSANLAAWAPTMATHLCPEQAEVYAHPYQTYRDGVHDAYWDERDMSAMLEGATAAVFVVHGTKDFNVKMDHVQTIWDKLPGPKRMLVGQWEHNIPWRNTYDFEQNWTQYNVTIDQFFDAYLKEDPVALAAEQAAAPVLVQDSANVTWELTAWPPVESAPTGFALGADGALAPGSAQEGEAVFSSSPVVMALREAPGPVAVEEAVRSALGAQWVAFETGPVDADARYFGNPWIDLNVTVDRPFGMIEARLYETGGDDGDELISLGWQNLATRTSRDATEDVPTGEPMHVRILMEAIAQVVEKGHGLKLVLSAENTETLTPQPEATTYTVALGGETGAMLWLPSFASASSSDRANA